MKHNSTNNLTNDFPISDNFSSLCKGIFRIQTSWKIDDQRSNSSSATAFAINKRTDGKLVLATAGHIFDLPYEANINWLVQQFDEESKLIRETKFITNRALTEDVPYRYHKDFDVGFLFITNLQKKIDGEMFSPESEQPLPIIEHDIMLGSSSRVCWIGFPGLIEKYLHQPALCYAEGVVSSILNREKRHLYIVDGHNSPGFSGGPVFYFCEEKKVFLVAGVVSGYLPDKEFPGFCCFEPINEVQFYINFWDKEEAKQKS